MIHAIMYNDTTLTNEFLVTFSLFLSLASLLTPSLSLPLISAPKGKGEASANAGRVRNRDAIT